MNAITRRRMLLGAFGVGGSLAGIVAADRIAKRYNLIPPDCRGVYGPGETLTYAASRVVVGDAPAREFSRSMISKTPFLNEVAPPNDAYKKLQASGWKLTVDGMVAHPLTLTLADLRAMAVGRQITEVSCEEGWSYVAEWIGTPLRGVLNEAGVLPQARYIVYRSTDTNWWDSLDMAEAHHPQTLLTWGMNDGDLPIGFGGPLRMRVPRQLGYKSIKYIASLTATDSMKGFGKGLGSASPEAGYSWFAGI